MKDIRPALRSYLLADSTVFGLVGGVRIYPVLMPQGQFSPSIVYNRITETTFYNMAGPAGMIQSIMQLDAWARSQDGAVALADAVHDRLSGQRGTITWGANSPLDEVVTRGVFSVNAREDYDAVAEMFRMSRDYQVWYLHG